MEKNIPNTLHICNSILHDTILQKTAGKLPPTKKQLSHFSCTQAQKISDAIFTCAQHTPDVVNNRINQDIEKQKENRGVQRKDRKSKADKYNSINSENRNDKSMRGSSYRQNLSHKTNGLGLVPLDPINFDSDDEEEDEQDNVEERMRDVKIHQEILRTQYSTTMKQMQKKMAVHIKKQGKSHQKRTIYDYDGSLIEPVKSDLIRFPTHFVDLEVNVDVDTENKSSQTIGTTPFITKSFKRLMKPTNTRAQFLAGKKQPLKFKQSAFLREMKHVDWVQGVSVVPQKQEGRKVVNPTTTKNIRKKKINLFSSSQQPRQMKMEELESYKGSPKYEEYDSSNEISQKNVASSLTILDRTQNKIKTINITNNRALQFLIRDSMDEPDHFQPQPKRYKNGQVLSKSHFHPSNNRLSQVLD